MRKYEKPMMRATELSCDHSVANECWKFFKNTKDKTTDSMFYNVDGVGYVAFSLDATVNNCSGGSDTQYTLTIENYYINGIPQNSMPKDYTQEVRDFIDSTLKQSNGGSSYQGDNYTENGGVAGKFS